VRREREVRAKQLLLLLVAAAALLLLLLLLLLLPRFRVDVCVGGRKRSLQLL
jgi:hypothetical protein